MATVTIGGNSYDVYADVAAADLYLAADIQYGTLWSNTTPDGKSAALVSATRYIDSKIWQGDKTSGAQALDWPRSGITDVSSVTVPQEVVDASILLAVMAVSDPTALSSSNTVNNVKVAKAGSASVENFKQSSRSITVFPSMVQNLIGGWLDGASVVMVGVVSGNTCVSTFDGDPFAVNTIN